MVGGKDVFEENGDITQESLDIDPSKVGLDGAVRGARSLVKPDWEEVAKVERWGSTGRTESFWDNPEKNARKVAEKTETFWGTKVEKLSQEQRKAYDNGVKVRELLSLWTNRDEQEEIVKIVNSIPYTSILYFLEWYSGHSWSWFFANILLEIDFPEKQIVCKTVCRKMGELAKINGCWQISNYFAKLAKDGVKIEDIRSIWATRRSLAKRIWFNISK